MDEFKASIVDLRKELSVFIKEHYEEMTKIWVKITEVETKQKVAMTIIGFFSGIVGSVIALLIKSLIK